MLLKAAEILLLFRRKKKKLVIGFCGFKTKNRKIYEDGQLMVY
jgi:hypothetical protein